MPNGEDLFFLLWIKHIHFLLRAFYPCKRVDTRLSSIVAQVLCFLETKYFPNR